MMTSAGLEQTNRIGQLLKTQEDMYKAADRQRQEIFREQLEKSLQDQRKEFDALREKEMTEIRAKLELELSAKTRANVEGDLHNVRMAQVRGK
jgi:hypothetical protein